jgi:hypothetical protein
VPAESPGDDDLAQQISDARGRFRKLGKSPDGSGVLSELAAFKLVREFMVHTIKNPGPFNFAARGVSPEQASIIFELVFLVRMRKAKAGSSSALHDVATMRTLDFQGKIDFMMPDYLYGKRQRQKSSEGGRKSKRQRNPDVIAACLNIRGNEPDATCSTAFKRMTTRGHTMPNGKIVPFKGAETSFRRHWTEAGKRLSR